MDAAIQQRRDLHNKRKFSWLVLGIFLIAIALREYVGGPHPEELGYRFSPMYVFTVQGMIFWSLVAAALGSVILLHRYYMAKEILLCCPSCTHTVSSKADWVCPYCTTVNSPLGAGGMHILFTVFSRCYGCKKSPGAYACPRCGTVFPLMEGAEMSRYAYSSVTPLSSNSETSRGERT